MSLLSEIKKSFKKSKVRKCYLADRACSSKIADCHSVQNNKILSKISDKGIVVCVDADLDSNSTIGLVLKEKGKKIASVFNGFCGKHDQELFREIDQKDFIMGNRKQEFLFAFRALAKELWNKETALDRFEGFNSQFTEDYKLGLKLSIRCFRKDFTKFRNWNKKANYQKIETFCLSLPREYLFAVSSFFTLAFDFGGRIINDFNNLNKCLKGIFLTIFPQNGRTYIIFSFLSYHRGVFSNFKKHLTSLNKEELKKALSNIIIGYVDNFFINPKNWDNIPKPDKEKFIKVFWDTTGNLPDKIFLISEPVVNFFRD